MTWSIAVIPVNEHGRVLTASALRVLRELGHSLDVIEVNVGPDRYRATREVLPDAEFDQLRSADAILVGAPPAGGVGVPKGLLERGIIFRMRFDLDLYINLRPFVGRGADVAVVRENTEGSYIGEGGTLRAGTLQAVATQGCITTWFGVERCVRFAFELARTRRRHLTLVHKVNVLTFAGAIWTEATDRLRGEFPDVECDYADIDSACVQLIEDAGRFDVIVTDNLFGDVISDVAGAVCGALARSGSADLNPAPRTVSLFEPLHAAATKAAAAAPDQVDPRGMYAAVAMLLRHRGHSDHARLLTTAINTIGNAPRPTSVTERAVLGALEAVRLDCG